EPFAPDGARRGGITPSEGAALLSRIDEPPGQISASSPPPGPGSDSAQPASQVPKTVPPDDPQAFGRGPATEQERNLTGPPSALVVGGTYFAHRASRDEDVDNDPPARPTQPAAAHTTDGPLPPLEPHPTTTPPPHAPPPSTPPPSAPPPASSGQRPPPSSAAP